jgi:hypothetical protein
MVEERVSFNVEIEDRDGNFIKFVDIVYQVV